MNATNKLSIHVLDEELAELSTNHSIKVHISRKNPRSDSNSLSKNREKADFPRGPYSPINSLLKSTSLLKAKSWEKHKHRIWTYKANFLKNSKRNESLPRPYTPVISKCIKFMSEAIRKPICKSSLKSQVKCVKYQLDLDQTFNIPSGKYSPTVGIKNNYTHEAWINLQALENGKALRKSKKIRTRF